MEKENNGRKNVFKIICILLVAGIAFGIIYFFFPNLKPVTYKPPKNIEDAYDITISEKPLPENNKGL